MSRRRVHDNYEDVYGMFLNVSYIPRRRLRKIRGRDLLQAYTIGL